MIENEIWIKAFDFGNYEVSNLGRVKSLYDNRHKRRDKILKLQPTNCGYLRAVLRKNNKTFYVLVHRLVMNSFNPINEFMQVNHINGVKTNNTLENLEWNTQIENQINAYKTGLQKPSDNGLKKQNSRLPNLR
ncbi:MAG: HNH endonuclease [Bacteroidota bacterium]